MISSPKLPIDEPVLQRLLYTSQLSYEYHNPPLQQRRNDLVFGMAIHLK